MTVSRLSIGDATVPRLSLNLRSILATHGQGDSVQTVFNSEYGPYDSAQDVYWRCNQVPRWSVKINCAIKPRPMYVVT